MVGNVIAWMVLKGLIVQSSIVLKIAVEMENVIKGSVFVRKGIEGRIAGRRYARMSAGGMGFAKWGYAFARMGLGGNFVRKGFA